MTFRRAMAIAGTALWPLAGLAQGTAPAPPGSPDVAAPSIVATPLPPPTGPNMAGQAPPQAARSLPQAATPPQASTSTEPSDTAPQWPNQWVPGGAARLQVLDKIDSTSKDLTVPVGQSATYGALTIGVQSCVVRPPDQPPDAAAYLVITDSHKDEPGFTGWSLANEPWVSMLQNPIYDVTLMGCGNPG